MGTKTSLGEWLRQARSRLEPVSENPGLEAQVLLSYFLHESRAWILTHPDHQLSEEHLQRLEELLARLAAGEPLPYLTGKQAFYGLDFEVSPAVLIPRPETELLVETALDWLAKHPQSSRIVDVGTGSGCIAVALAHETPGRKFFAVDRSPDALLIARRNAIRHHVEQKLAFLQADLLSAFGVPFDLICANLPYIPDRKLADLRVAQYEPRLALSGGDEGLDLIERLLQESRCCLAAGGLMLVEIEAEQGQQVELLVKELLPDSQVIVKQDLAGHDRLVMVERGA